MFTLNYILIAILASSALLLAEDPLCVRWQKNLSNYCLSKTTGLFKKHNEHQLDNPKYMNHLNETVEEIMKCFDELPCRTTRDNKMRIRVEAYRDTLFSLTEDFLKCSHKLKTHHSDCYYSWDPFMGVDEDGRILESFDKRDICKNYFGMKDCMRLEIVKHCTVEAWRAFKKNAKEFGERIYGCDLRGMFVWPIRKIH